MKKILLVMIALAIIALGYINHQKDKGVDDGRPVVKIGVILPLSGNVASVGEVVKGAMEVAINKVNQMDTKYRYELIFEDNVFTAVRTSTIMNKFVHLDKLDALLSLNSLPGNVISPIAEKNKIVHLNNVNADLRVAEGKYNFFNWILADTQANKLLRIIKKKNYQKVAIIATELPGLSDVADALEVALSESDIAHTRIKINPGTRDFRIDLISLKNAGYDFYIAIMFDPEISIFLKQYGELDITADVSSNHMFSYVRDRKLIEGLWHIGEPEGNEEFLNAVRTHNKNDNVFAAASSYDNVMLLVEAFERAETKETAVDELIKIKEYDGIAGRLVQDNRGIFQSEPVIKRIVNGRTVEITEEDL